MDLIERVAKALYLTSFDGEGLEWPPENPRARSWYLRKAKEVVEGTNEHR